MEEMIADHQLELNKLQLKGCDTELLQRTMEVFEDSLRTMCQHRDIIAKTIQLIDRGLI